jgi:hypothetical protein
MDYISDYMSFSEKKTVERAKYCKKLENRMNNI